MENIFCDIRKASGMMELYGPLELLLKKVEDILNGGKMRLEDVRRMTAPMTEIRLLLAELVRHRRTNVGENPQNACEPHLVSRYMEIEGKLKEMRNDLSRLRRLEQVRTSRSI